MKKLSYGCVGYEERIPYVFTIKTLSYYLEASRGLPYIESHEEWNIANDLILKFVINIDKHNPSKKKQMEVISKFTR